MIDLHLHTTSSDGRLTAEELLHAAAEAGIRTLAVTDHDTVAGLARAAAAARPLGIATIPGIEITAVHAGRDVHMLGYFFDPANAELAAFLKDQRDDRRRRLLEMAATLERLGVPVDVSALEGSSAGESGRALGRPLLAAALVRAGHVATIAEAFDRYLAEGQPAFEPRIGAAPAAVVALVARAGGVASLAHPGKLRLDQLIPELAEAGMPAIEVHHTDHSPADIARYQEMADRLQLLVTGGSDYHGPDAGRADGFGRVALPPADFERLAARVGWRADGTS